MDLDERLKACGWHGMSPWWAARLSELYGAQPHIAIGRVGRRGGKSSSWCEVGVAECTAGTWDIPHGDVGVYPIMSADKLQAADRVRNCVAICEALKIAHDATASRIRFPEHQTEIRVVTASVKGAVSATSIGGLLDEVAIWHDDTGANPASQIIDMLTPSIATQPGAFLALLSSPWTTRDPHAVEFDRKGEGRFSFAGATWEANPSPETTRDRCRMLSRTEAEFMRQYAARPLDATGGFAFPPSIVARAMGVAS